MKRERRRKSAAEIGRNMAAIRSTGNKTEESLRRLLHAMGLRYRKYGVGLVGKPDIVFPRQRVAVFVDGDYWHGRLLREQGIDALRNHYAPDQHSYWLAKMERNVARDEYVTAALRAGGWTVVRFWETDVRAAPDAHAKKIARLVRRRATTPHTKRDS